MNAIALRAEARMGIANLCVAAPVVDDR